MSDRILKRKKEMKIKLIFDMLDTDNDGIITQSNINNTKKIDSDIKTILKPVFDPFHGNGLKSMDRKTFKNHWFLFYFQAWGESEEVPGASWRPLRAPWTVHCGFG